MTDPQFTPSQDTTQSPQQVKHVHVLSCYQECVDCPLFDPDKVCASCGNRCISTHLPFMVTTTYIRDGRTFRLVVCGDCVGEQQRPKFYSPNTQPKQPAPKEASLLPEIDKKISTLEVNLSHLVTKNMHLIAAREPKIVVKEIHTPVRFEPPKPPIPKADPQFAGTSVVYFIQALETSLIKIGYSGNVQQRLMAINRGAPGGVKLIAIMRGDKQLESDLHRYFAHLSTGYEWFKPDAEIFDYIVEHCERNTGGKV